MPGGVHDGSVFHVLILRYRAGVGRAPALRDDHVAYLDRCYADGMFLASGQIPPDAGEVVLAVGGRGDLETVAGQDPLVRSGVADWEILTVDPQRVHEDLTALLAPEPVVADAGWDSDALRQLRAAGVDLAGALADRPISTVLQHVGQALLDGLAAGEPGLAAQARRCVAELQERCWPGDDILVGELSAALGETGGARPGSRSRPLQPVAVDLEELAGFLDGDPRQGSGVVDLSTGVVWPPGVFEFADVPAELDEDNEEFDPDRWLSYRPDSGEGYRDMLDFTETVRDGRWKDRLRHALDGRGAFRRFRDILDDAPEGYLRRWYVFRDERALGRARAFLAAEGYRATPPGSHPQPPAGRRTS